MSSKSSKKKGCIVPSRYKQAAEKISITSREKSTFRFQSRSRSLSPRSPTTISKNENSRPSNISTPTSEGQCTMPPIDESVISNINFSRSSRHDRRYTDKTEGNVTKSLFQRSSTVDSYEKISNQRNKDQEDDINILYCEYLQAKFIESCTIENTLARCKDSIEKIYKVWYYIQALLDKNAKVNKDLNVINYFIQTHEHLKKQDKMLLHILAIIPSLEEQYDKIAKAVHRAKHNLEVQNVVLPDCEKEIKILLEEISSLLSSITNAVEKCDKIINASDVKLKFVNQGKLISDELNRASLMLSEASTGLITEMSLKLS